MNEQIEHLFDKLWQQYITLNPTANKIHQLLKDKSKGSLLNDHIALRTFNLKPFGVDQLARDFISLGYKEKGEYNFKVKKLYAKHFEHEDKTIPKVFISELQVEKFSPELQDVFANIAKTVPLETVNSKGFSHSGVHWGRDYETYQKLNQESPYAAWLYAFGYCANHFTIFFNSIKDFKALDDLNVFLKTNGFTLNSSGGEIKGSPELFLEQSSTLAAKMIIPFSDGEQSVPSCYYEFARRYPKEDGQLYQGFVTGSADKIFESTNKSMS